MKFSLAQLALASCVVAAPTALEPRALTDLDILNFALTLEHLEATFYKHGLGKFGPDAFEKAHYVKHLRFNVKEIAHDENTHVTFLTDVIKSLGGKAVEQCEYDFHLSDVDAFVDLASILEGVGVTAYLGAAALISNKAYLTPAGAILTVESRHNAYIRANHNPHPSSPFPFPFDVPQTPTAVYTLASQFIKSCPKSSPSLGLKANPLLTRVGGGTGVIREGGVATFEVPKSIKLSGPVYAFFAGTPAPVMAPVKVLADKRTVHVTIPKGVAGQSYLSLHKSKTPTDANTIAGPAIVAIGSPYTIGGFPM